MTDTDQLPVLMWTIPCFDKRREQPLPVYNRTFILDWNRLSSEQRDDVLRIIDERDSEPRHSPQVLGSTVITFSRNARKTDNRMLRFRGFFRELGEDELHQVFADISTHHRAFRQVSQTGEYFEDETGKRISEYEMIQHVSDEDNPILIGEPGSVLRLGPVQPRDTSSWNVGTANTIAQFLEVVERICTSSWVRAPRRLTYESHALGQSTIPEPAQSNLLEAIFPNEEETMAVLAYIRQLHAQDNLLVKATESYLQHSGDGRKYWWVKERKESFERMVDGTPPGPFKVAHTRREIIRMFMYGAGMLHSSSKYNDDQNLAALLAAHGRQKAVMIFNDCMLDLFSVATHIYHVIRQDFDHWLTVHQLAKPDRQAIARLFENFVSIPRPS